MGLSRLPVKCSFVKFFIMEVALYASYIIVLGKVSKHHFEDRKQSVSSHFASNTLNTISIKSLLSISFKAIF